MQAAPSENQERVLEAIKAKRWSQLDEVWQEVLSSAPHAVTFHMPIIDRLSRLREPDRLKALYEPYLDAALNAGNGELAFEVIDYIVMHDERQDWVRGRLTAAILTGFKELGEERLQDILDRSGIKDPMVPLRKGIIKFEDMLGASRGQVFFHQKWGLGVVRDLDVAGGKVIIDFALAPNKSMTLDGVREYLRRIPKNHIQARMALEPDVLKDQTKTEPGEVLKLALKSRNGRIKAADLKKLLTERFLTENEYKSFWEKARKAIKLDPWIDQEGTGVHSELFLRSTPRSFFDEIFSQLLTAKDATTRREVLRDVRRHGSDAEMTAQDSEALFQLFAKPAKEGLLTDKAAQLNHGLLFLEFEELFEGATNPVELDALLSGGDVADLLTTVETHELRRLVVEHLAKVQPDSWTELAAEAAVTFDTRTVAWMEKMLCSSGHEAAWHTALENIIAKPNHNPDLFVWTARNLLEGSWGHLGETIRPIMICEELLSLLSEIEEDFDSPDKAKVTEAKNYAAKIRGLLNENNGMFVKKAAKQCTVEEARRLLHSTRLHNALSPQLKHLIENILINEHEDLRRASRIEEEEERKKPAYHYTTQQSLDDKRGYLSRLISIEIPGMAKVIETARELGDLKENSEYHAAKDRQKLLMQQAAELEDLIARARVVEAKEITPDSSRFGTTVKFKDLGTGETRSMTLMGMWEADLAKNIISYLTPFGSQMLGRKVGERFTVSQEGKDNEFEVLEIATALTS